MKKNLNLVLILFIFIFYSCSEKPVDQETKNERFSVLKYDAEISETLTLDISEIELSVAKEIFYWSKDFQNPQNNIGHINSNVNFSKIKRVVSGKPDPLNLTQPVFFENNLCYLMNDGFIECLNTETDKKKFKLDIKKKE